MNNFQGLEISYDQQECQRSWVWIGKLNNFFWIFGRALKLTKNFGHSDGMGVSTVFAICQTFSRADRHILVYIYIFIFIFIIPLCTPKKIYRDRYVHFPLTIPLCTLFCSQYRYVHHTFSKTTFESFLCSQYNIYVLNSIYLSW